MADPTEAQTQSGAPAVPPGQPWEKYLKKKTTLNINGQRVTVDESFLSLSPEEQNKAVDEIGQSLGMTSDPAPSTPTGYTEEQLKEAARKALADGNTASAKRLVDAARKAGQAAATSGSVIEAELFDGTILEFPAGTDPEVIKRKAKEITAQRRAEAAGASGAAAEVVLPGEVGPNPTHQPGYNGPALAMYADGDPRNPIYAVPKSEEDGLVEAVMGDAGNIGRSLQLGVQAAGRGIADFAGLAGDVSTGATNLALSGVDKLAEFVLGDLAPEALDYRFGPSPVGSDAIANAAGDVAERAGMDLIDQGEMTPWERIRYESGRFATGALAGGSAMLRAVPAVDDALAAARATGRPATAGENMTRAVVEPYAKAPGRVVAGDVAAGAGAGGAVGAVNEMLPEDSPYRPLAAFFGALAGGLGGAGAMKLAAEGVPAAVSAVTGRAKEWEIPLPKDGGDQISKRIADAAARVSQGMATDLPKARAKLAENLSTFPSPGAPKPSPMTMTEDPGLRGLERNYRGSGDPALAARLEAQDANAMDYATERLLSILDESADQPGALEAIRARPSELRAARDDAALPILRAAQESGVTVDAQPVADLLDAAMIGPKRPEVLRALQTARNSLNAAGDDQLDTSVSGLYESRKAISDLIDGRSESNTGKFAKAELIAARKALDEAIVKAAPEFRDYLDTFRSGSRPLDVFEGNLARNLVDREADLRNVAAKILSPTRYGTEREMAEVLQMIGDNPEAKRGWRAAVADVLVDRVTRNRAGEEIKSGQVVSVYNQHRDTLAKVFSPEDMKALDEVHNLVRMLDQPQAPGRSPNLGNTRMSDPISLVQAGLIASGRDMITTTIIVARLNFAARFLGLSKLTTPYKVNEVLTRMQFDPDLASMILNRPVAEGTGPTWSREVQKLLAAGAGAREMAEPDEDEATMSAIMVDGEPDGYTADGAPFWRNPDGSIRWENFGGAP